MSFCPKDGTEFPPGAAPRGGILVCPQCLLPYVEMQLPFVDPIDPDRLPLQIRNEYERAKAQMAAQRLAQAGQQKKLIL